MLITTRKSYAFKNHRLTVQNVIHVEQKKHVANVVITPLHGMVQNIILFITTQTPVNNAQILEVVNVMIPVS